MTVQKKWNCYWYRLARMLNMLLLIRLTIGNGANQDTDVNIIRIETCLCPVITWCNYSSDKSLHKTGRRMTGVNQIDATPRRRNVFSSNNDLIVRNLLQHQWFKLPFATWLGWNSIKQSESECVNNVRLHFEPGWYDSTLFYVTSR